MFIILNKNVHVAQTTKFRMQLQNFADFKNGSPCEVYTESYAQIMIYLKR